MDSQNETGTRQMSEQAQDGRIPVELLRRFHAAAVEATGNLPVDSLAGFTAGFRCYERVVAQFGKQLTASEIARLSTIFEQPGVTEIEGRNE